MGWFGVGKTHRYVDTYVIFPGPCVFNIDSSAYKSPEIVHQ